MIASLAVRTLNVLKDSFDPFVRKVNFMEKIHKEILGLMGKIDIDCRDEKGSIIIDLAGQLDVYNSHDVNLLIEAYGERGFEKFISNLEKVTYLDSSTISVFINCYQTLQEKGQFALAKLHDVFQIFPDVPSAISHGGKEQ